MENTTSDDWEPFWDEGYSDVYGPWIQSTEEYGFDPCPRCGRLPMLAIESPPYVACCSRGCPHPLFARWDWTTLLVSEDFSKYHLRWIWHQAVAVERNRMREEDGLP